MKRFSLLSHWILTIFFAAVLMCGIRFLVIPPELKAAYGNGEKLVASIDIKRLFELLSVVPKAQLVGYGVDYLIGNQAHGVST